MVDGLEVRLTGYQIFTDNDTIVLYTSARHHTVKFDDMPEFLRRWVPVEVESMPYYNHIMAEAGIRMPVNGKLSAPLTNEEKLASMLLEHMQGVVNDLESTRESLKTATLNIKDPKAGQGGQNYINQANQIANLGDKRIKSSVAIIQAFSLAHKMINKDKKDKPKKDE